MSNNCSICGIRTIFYVWTTTRNFPLEKYFGKMKITNKREMKQLRYNGRPICFHCLDELNK
jgi:hypothetical protein